MKKLLSAILALTMVVGSVAAMDVTESAENPALSYVVEAGIMQGYEDGLFYAEDDAEYAQVVQTLYNHAGQPAVTCDLVAISADAWYAPAAQWAVDAGLVAETITDGDMLALITNEDATALVAAYSDMIGVTSAGGTLEEVSILDRTELAELLYQIGLRTKSYDSEVRPLLLQGAMGIETTTMVDALTDVETYILGQYEYFAGDYCGYPVVVSRTEQGQANAGASTALAMEFFNPVAVINQGTSGGHDLDLHTFDIVIGENSFDATGWKSVASAEGAGVDYTALEMIGVRAYDAEADDFISIEYYPGDETMIDAANAVIPSYTQGQVVSGNIGTSDSWNNQVDRMLFYNEAFGSTVEEMETNSVAQICYTYDVPFLGIRILSNTGLYGEDFEWTTGAACQTYVLAVAQEYIESYLLTADEAVTANTQVSSMNTQSYDQTLRPILLQGAMEVESDDMMAALENPVSYTLGQWDFVAGEYNGYPVVVSRTEVGLSNCAAATALGCEFFNPIAIINQGTAGGHDYDLHTCDIVLGSQTINSAAWKTEASAQGEGVDYTAFEMNGVYAYDMEAGTFTKATYHFPDADMYATALSVADTYEEGTVVEGTIVTSNEWNNQVDRMLYLHEFLGSSCEEMETDAVAQMAATYDVAYMGIRILSNNGLYADETFQPSTGIYCQDFVLTVTEAYINDFMN